MAEQPRILFVDAVGGSVAANVAGDWPGHDVVPVADLAVALRQAQRGDVAGVYADTEQAPVRAQADKLQQAAHILDTMTDGVAVLDGALKVVWCNPAFERWDGAAGMGRPLQETLHCFQVLNPGQGPFAAAKASGVGTARLPCDRDRYIELHVTVMPGRDQFIVQVHDISRAELRQQKLDALHHAGRALNNLAASELADTDVGERVELLKHNVRQFIRDMLHYDVIELRLLDRRTGKLESLLQEGLTSEASGRPLIASEVGNGVTGYVAATGKSYLCNDTAGDPRFIEGAVGTRSSLTVPLIAGDEVIGTFNVESPRLNAFTDEDLQFTEMFAREVAQALHTLELLSAQQQCTGSESVEAIEREVALPVDDILTATTALLAGANGHDPETAAKLKLILARARTIKENIAQAGAPYAPPPPAEGTPQAKLHGMRVLVVDGDERARKLAHSSIGKLGCDVETAGTAQEAVAMALAAHYDAILLDIRPPGMSGYEAFCKLRAAQPEARMVMVTAFGYDESHAIVKAKADGLRFVVYKPFLTDQLVRALTEPVTS